MPMQMSSVSSAMFLGGRLESRDFHSTPPPPPPPATPNDNTVSPDVHVGARFDKIPDVYVGLLPELDVHVGLGWVALYSNCSLSQRLAEMARYAALAEDDAGVVEFGEAQCAIHKASKWDSDDSDDE
ncbi:hypothetical protein FB451DRAFT_1179001 [Mycena latifolia]|nr:hypothetical protein FB451DRAFT_1179001 [Mycena latifolia]